MANIKWNARKDRILLDKRAKGESLYRIANDFGITKSAATTRWHKIKPKVTKREISRTWCYVI